MGLYFRKSFGSGPFRLNFSKSGISYSAGVKGTRVNFSSRGTFVTFGINGIYYKRRIAKQSHNQQDYDGKIWGNPSVQHTITSGEIESLTDTDSQDFINELAEKNAKISYFTWFGVLPLSVTTILIFLLFFGGNGETLYSRRPILFWTASTVAGICFYFLLKWLKKIDVERLLVVIHYEIEEKIQSVYDNFIKHFAQLSSTSRSWQYLHSQQTNDYKYSSGASTSITRRPLNNFSLNRPPSKIFRTNVDIPYVGLINTELFFFPERLVIKRQNKLAAIMYKNIEFSQKITRFIEEDGVPKDSQIVGSTWKYLNKNGSPDKRFKNNRQLPICEYSEYHIESSSGVNEVIATSKVGCLDQFVRYITAIGTLQNNLPQQPTRVKQSGGRLN